jgi:predicted DsbA family dithiol-disulfide isomerase
MLTIDFVSDINCPWCALGLVNLEVALAQLNKTAAIQVRFQPFELNPKIPQGGFGLVNYLTDKYGMDQAQIDDVHNTLRERGAEVGFTFAERETLWNSFDAHRLLLWAITESGTENQLALKRALMQAYHGEARNISDEKVLLSLVSDVGLDVTRASEILHSDELHKEVRLLQQQWQQAGIHSVPSMVLNGEQLLQGAQPVDVLVRAINDFL